MAYKGYNMQRRSYRVQVENPTRIERDAYTKRATYSTYSTRPGSLDSA
jgi:hypothetical protein